MTDQKDGEAERAGEGRDEPSRRIDELRREYGGRECKKCGATMAHYRLYGYRCPHGCQQE